MSNAQDSPLTAAKFRALLEARWSCRGYLDRPVPQEQIAEMFDIAQRTASWCNTQPWQVHVVSGAARDRFSAAMTEHATTHEPRSDLPGPQRYVGVYLDRRRGAGFALYESLGIARGDKEARAAQHLKNFDFFGAPHVAIITTDANQSVYGALDCGGFVANVLNAATSLGIATIPQAAIAMHSDAVRGFLQLPEDRLVVCAISFGYADPNHPANSFRTTRAEPHETVSYLSD